MAKFTLTPAGVEAFIAQLYKFTDGKLQKEAVLLAEDPRAYIAEHFYIPVHQLEYLRSLDQSIVYLFGWSLAAALLSRRQIRFLMMNDTAHGSSCRDSCLLLSSRLCYHLSGDTISATGNLTIQVNCEK